MTYRLYLKDDFANAAALRGGMTMGEASSILSGADNVDFSDMIGGRNFRTISGGWGRDEPINAAQIQPIAQDIAIKYNINPKFVEDIIKMIYHYDTLLAYGDSSLAYQFKQGAVNHCLPDSREAFKKVWNYIRNRIHQGGTRPAYLNKATRLQLATQAAAARQQRQARLQAMPWYGSNPWVARPGQRSTRAGNYRNLLFERPKRKLGKLKNRYVIQTYSDVPVKPEPQIKLEADDVNMDEYD